MLDATVVMPCFNERDHVIAEIDRITVAMDASEYADRYELLVIDDGSTDGTRAVIEAALPRYPRIQIGRAHV